VGALIQADGPGQFGAQIQVFNGLTLLGTVSTTNDIAGDATYPGVTDTSGVKLNPRNFRSCGRATALFASLTRGAAVPMA